MVGQLAILDCMLREVPYDWLRRPAGILSSSGVPGGLRKAVSMRLPTRIRRLVIAVLAVVVLSLGGKAGVRWWGIRGATRPATGARMMQTTTDLPRLDRKSVV